MTTAVSQPQQPKRPLQTSATDNAAAKRTRVESSSSSQSSAVNEDDFGDDNDDVDDAALEAAAQAVEDKVFSSPPPPSSSASTSTRNAAQQKRASTPTTPTRPRPQPQSKPTATAAPLATSSSSLATSSDSLALERETMDAKWFARLESEMHKPYFTQLKQFLAQEAKAGTKVFPPQHLVHSWSRLTSLPNVKVVVVGQDPYHGPGQACGMSFSVPKGVPVPASLRNIYKELADEFPGQFKAPTHGNLESWARQGVLLLNACLTVRSGQAASHHGKGWEPFTRSILKLVAEQAGKAGEIKPQGTASGESSSVASTKPEKRQATLMSAFKKASKGKEGSEVTKPKEEDAKAPSSQAKTEVQAAAAAESRGCRGVVFLAWGQPAAKTLAEAGITEKTPNVLLLRSPHPSPLSAHRGFLGNGHFKRANAWLEDEARYGPGGGIRWGEL